MSETITELDEALATVAEVKKPFVIVAETLEG